MYFIFVPPPSLEVACASQDSPDSPYGCSATHLTPFGMAKLGGSNLPTDANGYVY